mgnify:CR=1 FL=1
MKVKVVKWCRKKWFDHNQMYIYHKQCEILQKNHRNSSNIQFQWFPIEKGRKLCKRKRWNGWSKSLLLENKVVINFDFRHGAKKSGQSDTIFTPKEWFLSKKGPKEGERVARGHFHERVGESPVHWLPPGVGFTQKPFSVSENGPFENFLRSNSIFI